MNETVVVAGSGYAGAGAINRLDAVVGDQVDVVWISKTPYHLLLHEAHRCVRDPTVRTSITIPVDAITSPETTFIRGEIERIDTGDRTLALADGGRVAYDYLLVAIGSRTAFFGIDGLREYAFTLKSLDDALAIHERLEEVVTAASEDSPARVVVGGAGLSGIQTAGEIAGYREDRDAPLEITLVEGLDRILPGNDPQFQDALRERLEAANVNVVTGEFVAAVDEETVYLDDERTLAYDALVWTGGITGHDLASTADVDTDERNDRILAGDDFSTADDRVFAIGDCALVDQPGGAPAPPTAQAAWQAATVAGENLSRAVDGRPLREWTYLDKGTVVSVGERAVAHDVIYSPLSTFGGAPARVLKKAIAARWIADLTSLRRAARAWPDL